MAVVTLSVARLLDLDVEIHWLEAAAVVSAADALSSATGVPITLEHCEITASGETHLSPPQPGETVRRISSMQLLLAMLKREDSTRELRALATAVEDGRPSDDGDGRLRVNLQWCLSADPQADVARLATRALIRGRTVGTQQPLVRTAPRAPISPHDRGAAFSGVTAARTHTNVTVRVARLNWGMGLTLAGTLCLAVGGAMATTLLLARGDARQPSPGLLDRGDQVEPRRPPEWRAPWPGSETERLPAERLVGDERPVQAAPSYTASR